MSDSQTTAWAWHTENLRGGTYYCVTGTGREVGIDIHEDDDGARIAPLIAAAPDLLAVAKMIVAAVEGGDEMAVVNAARAAISKAEGSIT